MIQSRKQTGASCAAVLAAFFLFVNAAAAEVFLNGKSYASFEAYYSSKEFIAGGMRCATEARRAEIGAKQIGGSSDCSALATNPAAEYAPGAVYRIPVVVHIIQRSDGTGALSDAMVQSQIEILNEDFNALEGSPGAGGHAAGIEFFLATVDPCGAPTTGITRSTNDIWFEDSGDYWEVLAWDPRRYLNIYTNAARGALGYVPFLPADDNGIRVGGKDDRVVILWSAFGRNGAGGPPYDQGRTATHEVGHYLGLEHPFARGCGMKHPPDCYATGDLICDTLPLSKAQYGCPSDGVSCGDPDPYDNYMNYTDDTCMRGFTVEQVRRMRCSIEHYRFGLLPGSGPEEGEGVEDVCGGEGASEGAGEEVQVCANALLLDSSFEGGSVGGAWVESSLAYPFVICSADTCGTGNGTAGPRSGKYFAWLGGISGQEEIATVRQTLTLPPALSATLSFYLWNGYQSGNGTDRLVVSMDGNPLATIYDGDPRFTAGYAPVILNVSGYTDGQPHDIEFAGYFSGSAPSNLCVDDVCIDLVTVGGETDAACLTNDVPPAGIEIYHAGFELGTEGYILESVETPAEGQGEGEEVLPLNLWHLESGCAVLEPSHDSTYAFYFGDSQAAPPCTYNTGGRVAGMITSPLLGLSAVVPPLTLSFRYWLRAEEDPAFDRATLEIAREGGPFAVLAAKADAPYSLCAKTVVWKTAVVDISEYAGASIQLRFGFDSRDGEVNAFSGFYVDDVRIVAAGVLQEEGESEGEGMREGHHEGEGIAEGEDMPEAESSEGQPIPGRCELRPHHSGDTNEDHKISLTEMLRVIQLYNSSGYSCAQPPVSSEDGFRPGAGAQVCVPHDSDYQPQDWAIGLGELLRLIQLFRSDGYRCCEDGEEADGYCLLPEAGR